MLAILRWSFYVLAGFKVKTGSFYHIGFAAAAAALFAVCGNAFGQHALLIAAGSVTAFAITLKFSKRIFSKIKTQSAETQQPLSLLSLSADDVLDVFPNPAIIFDAQGIAVIVNPAAKATFRGFDTGIGFNQWFRDTAILSAFASVKANLKTASGKPASVELIEKRPLERAFRVDIAAINTAGNAILMVFTEHTEVLRVDRMRADFIAIFNCVLN